MQYIEADKLSESIIIKSFLHEKRRGSRSLRSYL